jgi:signal transduction histidine kinase
VSVDDDLRGAFLTEGLSDAQRADLVQAGEEVGFTDGQTLFVEGEPASLLWILLDGEIDLSRTTGGEETVIATMTNAGQWAGGLEAWGEGAGYRATGRGVGTGRALTVPSGELRRLVGEWFPFGGHMIVGIWQTVRGIEASARQRESLVALGTMAAGLAHEINNPAAAALRAVNSMGATCDAMLTSLTSLAGAGITADQFVAIDDLRRQAIEAEAPTGAMALSDLEETLGVWLDAREVDDAWQLAANLAGAGVDVAWCERVADAVGAGALAGALAWVASVVTANDLLAELRDTTTRISNLVVEVKNYSQMDRASLQSVDVCEGIDATLAMLAHKLHDVEVELDYQPDVPRVEVYAGELNQVWTNLIDNAVDAMAGRGTLRISVRVEHGDLVVGIADTGPGMTESVLERAFEPFFTTKDVGKGTGLGLDISRRIVVERHRGDIDFDVSASGTTARVRIPLRR